jgi:hypothetical protein
MRKRRIKLLNKYIIACHIKINKGTKVFYVPSKDVFAYPRLNTTALGYVIVQSGR